MNCLYAIARFVFPIVLYISLLFSNIHAGEQFILGAEDQAGPWGKTDGTGCGNDIVKAAFAAAGDSVVLSILPYVRAKKMTMDGELAGCFSMSWEPNLKGKVALAEKPLYQVQVILLAKHATKSIFHSLEELSPQSILGLVKDYEYPSSVRALAKKGIRIEETASEVQNLKKLAAGRIDATVVCCDPLKSFTLLLEQSGKHGCIDSVSVVGIQGSYVGFSLKNAYGLHAKQQFDKGMAIIVTNKTYDAIVKKWILMCEKPVKGGN